ncbi:MAG: FtsQ-type POTRA domain-containing protein [Dehalococcoidia bacterium]|nr:FtsQ-type POTRA domain-containing protein [Dehalococcoidia bacterium]
MIVKRNRNQKNWPRAIVKRSSMKTVGDGRPRQIVNRRNGSGVQPMRRRRRLRLSFGWRPTRGFVLGASVVVVAGAIMASAYWLYQSPLLQVQHIEVEGTDRIGTHVVVQRAGLLGDSMFSADLAAAQEAIWGHPLVASVRVERAWPNTIRIFVEERRSWGAWEQGGVRYTIDRDGVVLGTTAPAEGSPVIRSSEATSLRQGDRVDYQAVQAAAEIYELLPRQLGTTVTEVAFLTGKGVQVTTADGQSALFGDSSSIAYKLSVWAAMSQQARTQGINYTTIDLRFGNRPVLQ